MEQPVSPLARLGKAVARAQDEGLAATEMALPPARLLAAAAAPRARRWLAPLFAIAAALAVGVLALALWPRPLAFEIGPAAALGRIGEWVAAPPGADLPLRFSDGSRLALAGGSRARVASVTDRGAQLVLERGRLEADVAHREGTRWAVAIGPFEVKVTGTRFTAAWDGESETLDLTLHEGSVLVTGPTLGEGRTVAGGEALRVSARAVSAIDVAPAVHAPIEAAPAVVDVAPPPQGSAAAAPAIAPAPRVSWRDLAAAARYAEALAQAEGEGFEALCEASPAGDLLALGDAARLAGSGARARQAYGALRSRFPGDARAGAAAFVLGRMAFDHAGAYAEASLWFSTYLAEQPGGSLAREAAGRLVEARERAGDRSGAAAAAKSYLASYPDGPHAAKAKSLVDE